MNKVWYADFMMSKWRCLISLVFWLSCLSAAPIQASEWPDERVPTTEQEANSSPANLPQLRLTTQRTEVKAFPTIARPFPLKRDYYGFQEGQFPHTTNALVEENYILNRVRVTRYTIEPQQPADAYIFDPILLPDGQKILFKYGRADLSIDGYSLYLFDRRTHSITVLANLRLYNRDVQISPDGRFVSFIHNGGPNGVDESLLDILEL